ncbi:MAG: helix-turn-helix transcriptional regulator [Xanthobacteraceae bacterium]
MFLTMTGEQLRAARAMVRWDQEELAQRANVSVKTIKRLEAVSGPLDARSNFSIKNALELAGIEFLDADDYRSRGDGVRFHKDRTATLRRKLIEDVSRWLEVTLKMAVEKDEDLFERPAGQIVEIVSEEIHDKLTKSIEDILRKES